MFHIVNNFNIYIYLPIIGAGFLPFAVCVFHGEASGNSIVASDARDGTIRHLSFAHKNVDIDRSTYFGKHMYINYLNKWACPKI